MALPPEVTTVMNAILLGYNIFLAIVTPFALLMIAPAVIHLITNRGRNAVDRGERFEQIQWVGIGYAIALAGRLGIALIFNWLMNAGLNPNMTLPHP